MGRGEGDKEGAEGVVEVVVAAFLWLEKGPERKRGRDGHVLGVVGLVEQRKETFDLVERALGCRRILLEKTLDIGKRKRWAVLLCVSSCAVRLPPRRDASRTTIATIPISPRPPDAGPAVLAET